LRWHFLTDRRDTYRGPGPVSITVPILSGAPVVGATLTASVGTWANNPNQFAYAWTRGPLPIAGAMGSALVLGPSDAGHLIRAHVVASNDSLSATASSVPVTVAWPVGPPPVNTTAPVVTGTPTVGQTLICVQGTWTGATGFARQWRRDGAEIAGATSPGYTLIAADTGAMISCLVTATGPGGSADALSNEVGPIAP
jgi:hypothetical protein